MQLYLMTADWQHAQLRPKENEPLWRPPHSPMGKRPPEGPLLVGRELKLKVDDKEVAVKTGPSF